MTLALRYQMRDTSLVKEMLANLKEVEEKEETEVKEEKEEKEEREEEKEGKNVKEKELQKIFQELQVTYTFI